MVTAGGRESVLYAFKGGSDGMMPYAGLLDEKGNLYGTTEQGGLNGKGTVFELTRGGTEKVLYSFAGGSDGAYPEGRLIKDSAGNLFGTTLEGGGAANAGTVFEVVPAGTEKVLHSFCSTQGCVDGANPVGGLVEDPVGNLYGTTQQGGYNKVLNISNSGTVFELAPDGAESVLYAFAGGAPAEGADDGAAPNGDLVRDKSGNFYGTTNLGGASTACGSYGCGTVFELSATGNESSLHSFGGGSDGASPEAGLIAGTGGHLYGTTEYGGGAGCGDLGCGTVFTIGE